MKYLVTGASGQLGSEWLRYFRENQIPFTGYNSAQFDITDKYSAEQIIDEDKPDVVINCAAYTKVDQAESEPDKAFLVNETGVKNLAEACSKRGINLIHYSTDYVFSGAKKDRERYPDGYPEDAPSDPINIYGKSKRAGEIVLENSSANWLLIRVSWLCGASGSNFVKTMLMLSEARDRIDVVSDQTGSPSFTFDVVEKTIQLMQKELTGIFHVSSRGEISWADFAREIFELSGKTTDVQNISSSEFPVAAKRPSFSLLSNQKIISAGLKPADRREALKRLLQQIKLS